MNIEQANNSFQSMHLTGKDGPIPDYSWKMATVIGGAYFVFVAERLLKFVLDNRKVDTRQLLKPPNMIRSLFFLLNALFYTAIFKMIILSYNFIFIIL